VTESSVVLPPDLTEPERIMPASSHDSEVPRPTCPTCGTEMRIVMAPPPPTPEINQDWLFQCQVCKVMVRVPQT
jgi:hypothetical protein